MGGWWDQYSFRCQPVDYSNNPTAVRVSLVIRNFLCRWIIDRHSNETDLHQRSCSTIFICVYVRVYMKERYR